jgi:hypothetical protein
MKAVETHCAVCSLTRKLSISAGWR